MKTNKKPGKKTVILLTCALLAAAAICIAALFWFGVLHFNNIDRDKYPIAGVDVSRYQGEINWKQLSSQDIQFAFIKATEGSSYTDPRFEQNWRAAAETDLRIGAYHFFSFESSGAKQAEHFCNTVDCTEGMLPPAIDVEYYGRFKSKDDIDTEQIKKELRDFVDCIEVKYSVKPIIYVSANTYNDIIKNDFTDCLIWYRSVYSKVPESVSWTFWQYSDRHVLKGYKGEERYIDMNVFKETEEEFLALLISN